MDWKKCALKWEKSTFLKFMGAPLKEGIVYLRSTNILTVTIWNEVQKRLLTIDTFIRGMVKRGSNYVQSWEGGWYVQGSLLGACTYLGMFSRFWYLHVPRPVMVSAQTIFSLLLVHIFHILLKPFLAK